MENVNWNQKELEAYFLIYCANADFKESEEELEFIKEKVGEVLYRKMHKEFYKDNDFQSIKKIELAFEKLGYTAEDKQKLLAEVKALFQQNDRVDASEEILEANLLRGLKHLFS